MLDVTAVGEVGGLGRLVDELAEPLVLDVPGERLVEHLAAVEAQDGPGGLVGDDDVAEGVGDHDGVAQGVQHRLDLAALGLRDPPADLRFPQLAPQARLALAKLLEGADEGAGDRPDETRPGVVGRAPLGGARGLDVAAEPDDRAVEGQPHREEHRRGREGDAREGQAQTDGGVDVGQPRGARLQKRHRRSHGGDDQHEHQAGKLSRPQDALLLPPVRRYGAWPEGGTVASSSSS